MSRLRYWLLLCAYWCEYGAWWFAQPGYKLGDPTLGTGELREHNRRILKARYASSEPKRPTLEV